MNVDKLLARLRDSEGTGPRKPNGNFLPYRDSKGILTIGFGYNLEAHGLPLDIVERLLMQKVLDAYHTLERQFPGFIDLDEVRQSVLTDMAYNMGPLFWKSWPIFVSQIQRGDWEAAARNMRSTKWYNDVGPRRADPLIKMMRTGAY